ncbi:uncharacterized protein TERG_11752 [Trichophyton rubrum CBS 118892]|uniref:Uncharacterized protein n=3 Tax=Trichophyton TaxID=5550 RepID=A0A080WER2_TRIRC|nr:uncharacterized protein TERG_11752 [Trichophyton rubrum CBS 118892]KFL60681.1 hypothetical protein TERG_11752 [Trichophyton rubrum CBS 118892]
MGEGRHYEANPRWTIRNSPNQSPSTRDANRLYWLCFSTMKKPSLWTCAPGVSPLNSSQNYLTPGIVADVMCSSVHPSINPKLYGNTAVGRRYVHYPLSFSDQIKRSRNTECF